MRILLFGEWWVYWENNVECDPFVCTPRITLFYYSYVYPGNTTALS